MELIAFIKDRDTKSAMELIENNIVDVGYIDNKLNTPLIMACKKRLSTVAVRLIATGRSKPDHINRRNYSAIIYAAKYGLASVVDALILTNADLGHPSGDGSYYVRCTALEEAIQHNHINIAYKLLATGRSKPEYAHSRWTALILACIHKLPELALALIATGKSNPTYKFDNTAFSVACRNQLYDVMAALIIIGAGTFEEISKIVNFMHTCNSNLSPDLENEIKDCVMVELAKFNMADVTEIDI